MKEILFFFVFILLPRKPGKLASQDHSCFFLTHLKEGTKVQASLKDFLFLVGVHPKIVYI